MPRRGAQQPVPEDGLRHPQDDIPLRQLNPGYRESAVEDAYGYVDPSPWTDAPQNPAAGLSALSAGSGDAAPRRPSVPAHTREILKQLPSRNLDDLSSAEPDGITSERVGSIDATTEGSRTLTARRRAVADARYLTLRVRNAAALNASDMNADDLYNILMRDPHLSNEEALETLRNAKQSLTLKRSVRRRLTVSQRDAAARRHVSWCRRTRYGIALALQKAKYEVRDVLSHMDLWHSHLKVIQGNYGSGVTSYFLFLRRMFLLNVFMAVCVMGFVTVPQIVQDRLSDGRRQQQDASVGYVNSFVNIFTGAGAFYNSLMYYGRYSNETVVSASGTLQYDMPLAYLLTMFGCLLCCLVILASSLTGSYKRNYIETSVGVRDVYSAKVFAAWDFSIESREAAMLKSRSIYNELKELLSMEKGSKPPEPLSVFLGKIACRILVNLVIVAIVGGSGYLVHYLLSKESLENNIPVLSEMTVALVVGALCFVVPTVFLLLSGWEFFESVHIRLYVNLFRVTLIKIVLLGVLMYFWLSSSHVEEQCWESRLGQEIYRLLMVDLVFVLLLTTGVGEVGWGILYHYVSTRVGPPELDVAHNTLDLIYTQTLVWVGVFYCPFLPLVASLKLFLTFYVKRCSVTWTLPSVRPWRAVHAQTVFLVLTFVSFLLSTGVLGYAVLHIRPSSVCGPFRGSRTAYDTVLRLLSVAGLATGHVVTYALSPFVVFLTILTLGLVLYYVRALASAHGEMVRLLREQLILEGKDKVFLLQLFEKAMEQRMMETGESPQVPGRGRAASAAARRLEGSPRSRRAGSSSAEGSPRRGSAVNGLPRPVHQQGFRYRTPNSKGTPTQS